MFLIFAFHIISFFGLVFAVSIPLFCIRTSDLSRLYVYIMYMFCMSLYSSRIR